jgi:hypothetical protein
MSYGKVLIFDTSILCIWLEVPGMDTCGPSNDSWNKKRIDKKVDEETKNKSTFILPLATIIETGNHIAQTKHSRWELGQKLADLLLKTAREETPWATFTKQSTLWTQKKLEELAQSIPQLFNQRLSLGDITIKDITEEYGRSGYKVEIFTGDQGLRSYQPPPPKIIPRRRH